MPRTTIRQRWSVIALNGTGMKAPDISRRLGIPRRTVYGILSRHAVRPNEVKDLPCSGRPRKTTPREDRRLGRLTPRNRFCTSIELRRRWNLGRPVSSSLVRRRLSQLSYHNRRPVRKPVLTRRHRQVWYLQSRCLDMTNGDHDMNILLWIITRLCDPN